MKRAAVVGQLDLDAAHHAGREPGFATRNAARAQGALLEMMGRHLERGQRHARHAHVGTAAAAIDDGAGSQHPAAGRAQNLDDVGGAAAGGDHVFHHHRRLAGRHGESPAQRHLSGGGIAFGEEKARSERARHLVADDEAAQGGGGDQVDFSGRQRAEFLGQQPPEPFRGGRMLQHQRALQVLGAVQAAGEAEVAFEVCAGGPEQLQDGLSLRRHRRLLYH